MRALPCLLTLAALSSCAEMEPRSGARTRGVAIPAPNPQAAISSELGVLREENDMLRNRVQDIEAQMLSVNQDVSKSRQDQARELQAGNQSMAERIAALERKLVESEKRQELADQRLADMDKAQQARMQQMQERILSDISGLMQPAPSTRSASKASAAGPGEHRVVPGDTLSTIARKHGTSTQRLMEANGITNADQVRVGQLLKIP